MCKHQDLMIIFQHLATSSLELIRLRTRWEFTSFRWFTTKATKVFGPILWSAPMAVASTVAVASSLMEARVCAVEGAWYTFFRCFRVFTSFHMFHFISLPNENQTIEKQTCLTHDFVSSFIHIFDSGPGSMRLFPSQQVSIGVWSPHCFSALGRCSWCQVMIRPHNTINWWNFSVTLFFRVNYAYIIHI